MAYVDQIEVDGVVNEFQDSTARQQIEELSEVAHSGDYNDLLNKPDLSGFITRSVNDLVNYYTKTETYTKTEVNNLVNAIKQFTYEVVATLPTASASTMYKIYLVPATTTETQNIKDEYITIKSGNTYSWEQIGSTAVDLSGYSTTEQMNAAIANALTNYYTKTNIDEIVATLNTGIAYDVSALHPTSGVNGGNTYASLSAALAVIPQDKRKGGMTIKYVHSSDNTYVQYFCNSQTWTIDTRYWEKINLESQLDQEVDENNQTAIKGYIEKVSLTGLVNSPVQQTGGVQNSIIFYIPAGVQKFKVFGLSSFSVAYLFASKPQVGDTATLAISGSSAIIDSDGVLYPVSLVNTTGYWALIQFNTEIVDVSTLHIETFCSRLKEDAPYDAFDLLGGVPSIFIGQEITAVDTTIRALISPVGNITTGYAHYYVYKYNVLGKRIVFASGVSYTSTCLLAAYDSNDKCLRTYKWGTNQSYNQLPILLPANTSYVLVTNRDAAPILYDFVEASYAETSKQGYINYRDIVYPRNRKYYKNDGTKGTSDARWSTIDILASDIVGSIFSINIATRGISSIASCVFFSADGTVLGTINADFYLLEVSSFPANTYRLGLTFMESQVPEGDPEIVIRFYNVKEPYGAVDYYAKTNPYDGKIGVVFGDSIINGVGSFVGQECTETMKHILRCDLYNGGIGGASYNDMLTIANSIASGDWSIINAMVAEMAQDYNINQFKVLPTRFADIEALDFSKVDFIVMAYGTNDWYNEVNLDNPNNKFDTTTTLGRFRTVVQTLQTNFPNLLIMVVTPSYRVFSRDAGTGEVTSDSDDTTRGGITLGQFADALADAAKEMKLACWNQYWNNGVNKYTAIKWLSDGTHRNEAGYELLGRQLAAFILNN